MNNNPITAVISPDRSNRKGLRLSHVRDKGFKMEFAMLIPCEMSLEMIPVVTLRIYQPGSVAYACLLTKPRGEFAGMILSGSGRAGSCGYDRSSAAANDAIYEAGFDLSCSISGVGENAVKEAVIAISKAIGHEGARLHVARG